MASTNDENETETHNVVNETIPQCPVCFSPEHVIELPDEATMTPPWGKHCRFFYCTKCKGDSFMS